MNYILFNILKTSIVISIPIICIYVLKDKILNKYTYKLNYIICILITLRMLFISSVSIYLPVKFLNYESNTVDGINSIISQNSNTLNYIKIIFGIWLVGTIYHISKNIYKQIIFYKKIENITYTVNDTNIIKCIDEEKNNLNIKRNINVFKVDGLSSPALIGVINNKIIMPNRDYDNEQLKWIFRHELIHFKRKDNFFKLLLMVASSIHWFNPLVKILNKYFNEQCELSCDEVVLKRFSVDEIKNYALVLVNTLRYRNALKATLCSSQFNESEIDLIKNRLEGMLSSKKRKNGTLISILICIISVVSILSINVVTGVNDVHAIEPNKNYKNLSEEEILMNFENNETKDSISLYPDRKLKDLTEEEKNYASSLLHSGKYRVIKLGSDSSMSINLDYLKSKVNK